MPALDIIMDGDNCWPDLPEKHEAGKLIDAMEPPATLAIAVLDGGMAGGLPSVTIRIDLPDGRVLMTQTSARLFCAGARAIMAKYPNLFRDN